MNCDRNVVKRDLALLGKDNGRKEMTSQNLTVVFRNSLMDYTVPILDTNVREEEVKIVTRKRQLMFHQRNLHQEAGQHGESQLNSTLDEITNVGATVTYTEEADFVVAELDEEPSAPDGSPSTKKPRGFGSLPFENLHKDVWMKDIGSKLFDIRSSHCLNKINNCKKDEKPETFENEYYLDQLDPSKRKKFVQVTKVTKEYMEEERQKQLTLARKLTCELSGRRVNPEVGEDKIQNEWR